TAKIFNMMADFEKRGIKIYQIIKSIFGSYSYKSVKLKGLVLSTLELSSDKKIAWLKVEKSFLEKTNTDSKNTSGLVNYARDIKGVEVGIVFIEAEDNSIKVGLRSNNYCPVNKIAAYFDGGGHERAAGCIVTDSLDKAVKKVINKVENYV
ncbi:MAG: DHH family phosphoesterase, partial [Halanaerobiales bacterium]